jgi:hypothetical protein
MNVGQLTVLSVWHKLDTKRNMLLGDLNTALDFDDDSQQLGKWTANDRNHPPQITLKT